MNAIAVINKPANFLQNKQNWQLINWKKMNRYVKKLRQRIFRAEQLGQKRKVKKLQRLMLRSKANLLVSIRKVTQKNQGKNTPGIDQYLALTPKERIKLFNKMSNENVRNVRATAVRRINIPKKNTKKTRPLGIPIIKDRVYQNIVKNALEPQWEVKFEPTMYGFRPKRSIHDAIGHIYLKLHAGSKRQWVFEGDYKGCFDNISHNYIMECIKDFPAKSTIYKWIKAGYIENGVFENTNLGTPQGGLISPLLANISLNGLNEEIGVRYRQFNSSQYGLKLNSPGTIIYADDFLILCHTKEEAESMYKKLQPYLKKRGLTLAENKTQITNIKDGFDFLGFNIKQYKIKNGTKLLIKPSIDSVKKTKLKIKEIILKEKINKPVIQIIKELNPVLRGIANNWSTQVSKKTYSKIDHYTWLIIYKYLGRLHKNKSWRWKYNKYFKSDFTGISKDKNILTDPKENKNQLIKMSWTPINRHWPIKYKNSPDDSSLEEYFERRDEKLFNKKNIRSLQKISKKSNYKCRVCGLSLVGDEKIKVNNIIPKLVGGSDKYTNLEALHESCYKQHIYLLIKYCGGRKYPKLKQFINTNEIIINNNKGVSLIKNRYKNFNYKFV